MAEPSLTIDPDLLRTVESRHGPITLFRNDTSAVGQSLQLYGEWAENEIGFLKSFVRSSMTVLDVGAFIGTHALALGRAVGPTGSVWAFEPQPSAFALLERNIAVGGLHNVRLMNAAVADRQGSVAIPAIDPEHSGSFGSATLNDQLRRSAAQTDVIPRAVTVKAVTIDSLDLPACDLMKIDVEGAEDIVLRGAASTIKRLKPIIYAECNSVSNGLATWNVLRELGYEVRLHLVDSFVADNFFHAKENIFGACREAALVGVPPERAGLLDAYKPRPCEMLVRLADADDLVLGLLNKPQYPEEILNPSIAAADGADAWLRDEAQLRVSRNEWEDRARLAQRDLSAALHRAQAERSERDRLLSERDSQLSERDRQISERDRQMSERDVRLSEAARQLVERDGRLSDQERQLSDHVARIADLQAAASALRAQLDLKDGQLAKFAEDLSQRRASVFFKLFREIMRIERQARGLFARRRLPARSRADTGARGEPDEEGEQARSSGETVASPVFDPVTLRVRLLRLAGTTASQPPEVLSPRPLVVCLSHILPWPTRAGNEYGSHRMLSWFMSQGWDVVLLYCPLPGEEATPAQLAEACRFYDNLVLIGRDGLIGHRLERPDVAKALRTLDGRRTRDVAALVGETRGGPVSRLYLPIRTFCPDVLVEVAAALDEALGPRMVLANYVFTTRALRLLKGRAIRAVQSHDVFSTKAEKVVQFGVEDSLAMSAAEEGHLLGPADLVLSVQPDEAKALRKLAPHAKVLMVGIDMPVIDAPAELPTKPVVLMVASGNAMNTKGLRDFLRFAWPIVLRDVPEAELHVAGSVGSALAGNEPGVRRLGFVPDLGPAYASARVVINPAVAGTGLKIKTLEALANLRPIVVWPSGVDGMTDELAALCVCATDWYAFADAVVSVLRDDSAHRGLLRLRDRIADVMSPKTVFAELECALVEVGVEGRSRPTVAAQ